MFKTLPTTWQIAHNKSERSQRMTRYALAAAMMLIFLFPEIGFASDFCNPPNVIPQSECDFDSFYGDPPRQVPNGWAPFVLSGDPSFLNDPHSFFGSGTLRIMSNNSTPLKAGIYKQVNVNPGSGYRASVAWAAPNAPTDAFGRQLGLDPTGGSDPNSPNIIWGPMHYGDGRFVNYPPGEGPNIDVKARATGGTMTVFFLADLRYVSGANLIYIDVISLFPDESAPGAAAPIEPTATETPVAAAPVEESAVQEVSLSAAQVQVAEVAPARPLLQFSGTIEPPTPLATDTPLPIPTETLAPIPTDTATSLPTNTPLPSPTWTPWPTSLPASALTIVGAQTQVLRVVSSGSDRMLTLLSGSGLLGSLLLGGVLFWSRRRK